MSASLAIVLVVAAAAAVVILIFAHVGRRRRSVVREAILREINRKSLETFGLEEVARETNVSISDARRVAREIYADFYRKYASDGVLTEAERNDLTLLADRLGMNEIEVRYVEQRISEGLFRPVLGRQRASAPDLSDADLRTLRALRSSLRLPGRGAVEALERRAIEVYRKKFSDFASDGMLDDEEIRKLQSLADQIGLDQAEAIESIKGDALRLIERVYAFARQDRVITEGEEEEILRLQRVLNISDDEIFHIKDEIQTLRSAVEARRGKLPSAESPIPIPKGELCHWAGECAYSGDEQKKKGALILTSERVLFASGDSPDFEIPYDAIKNIIELPDGLQLECDREKGSGAYSISDGCIALEMLLCLTEGHGVNVKGFEAEASRDLPHHVKLEVWERDLARCTRCSSIEEIEFEFAKPLSEGGEAAAENVRLVCRKCRLKARRAV